MAKGKLKLKWRLVKGEWRAGPFSVIRAGHGKDLWESDADVVLLLIDGYRHWDTNIRTIEGVKRACEKLASRILGAMK